MKHKNVPGICLLAALLAALSSCSTTSLTDSWQSPALHRKSMDHVLVVADLASPTNRVLYERGFVEALTSKGIQAIASCDVIGNAPPTRESVVKYLATSDIQYVIASRFGGAEITKERIPESVRTYYTGPYYPTFGGYWDQNTVTMTRESYVDQRTSVVLTTSIFDAKTQDLVWAGRSKTFEVRSVVTEANDLAHLIVNSIKN